MGVDELRQPDRVAEGLKGPSIVSLVGIGQGDALAQHGRLGNPCPLMHRKEGPPGSSTHRSPPSKDRVQLCAEIEWTES